MSNSLDELATRFCETRVLVTGAAGFVGANLVRRLVAVGCVPHTVIRPGSRPWRLDNVANQVVVHEVDVADALTLDAVFAKVHPEFVIHLAVPRGNSEAARDEMLRVNVLGALTLLRCVKQYAVKRLVVAGSCLEYAQSPSALREDSAVSPHTWHGATKAAAHVLFRQAALAEGVPVVLLRMFHIYGPWESAHRLCPTAIRAALSGTPMALTAPNIRRDWVFVDDVVQALLLAADRGKPGDVFNIGSGIEIANEELVHHVESVTGHKVAVALEHMARRVTDADHRFADRSLAAAVLGWIPHHDLFRGLRRTVAWYEANPDVWSTPGDVRPETV